MEGMRREGDPDKPSANQFEKELRIMGIRYWQRTARDRKE